MNSVRGPSSFPASPKFAKTGSGSRPRESFSPSLPLRNLQPPHHRRTRDECGQHAPHVRKVPNADELTRFIEADQIAHPRESRDIGNRIGIAENPLTPFQPLLQHAEQTLGLGDITIARTLVLVLLAGELMEETELAEHRADAAHL